MATGAVPRRRRTPEAARAEILGALAQLLQEVPSEDVTVAALMDRTSLSRKSFYFYFRDRAHAIAALVTPLRAGANAALERWRSSDDVVGSGRAALASAAWTYRAHGPILRALATASQRDEEAARVWAGFIDPLREIAADKIAAANAGLDSEGTAQALVTMNVHCLLGLEPDATDAELEALVITLSTIWERTIFPEARPPSV